MTVPEQRLVKVVQGACHVESRTEWIRQPSSVPVSVPALTHTVVDHVMVRPPGWRIETIPPVVDLITEDVVVRPARREWRPAGPLTFAQGEGGPWAHGATPTGEVLCLVDIPAEVRRITREVVRSQAQTISIPTPAVYEEVQRVVVDAPAHEERRDYPGESRQTSARICDPPRTVEEIVAPVFADIPTTEIVSPAKTVWRETACAPKPRPRPCGCGRSKTGSRRPHAADAPAPAPAPVAPRQPAAMTPAVGDRAVRHLQEALGAKGYFHGAPDGLFTKDTVQAMTRFQHDRHLAEGRYTGETADALGLN
jgi:hypothetical protein